jgi:hypothetical protein
MGEPEKLAAESRAFDGFELVFHIYPGRNARLAELADSAYPAREYDR